MLERRNGPAGIALTRQNLPVFERGDGAAERRHASPPRRTSSKGAYVLAEAPGGKPDVILIATGSEVQFAVDAREVLKAEGVNARVVSVPCQEWFEEQDAAYRESVLPDGRQGAGLDRGRHRPHLAPATSATPAGASRSSTSAHPPTTRPCTAKFGITTEAAVAAAKESLAAAGR